MPPEPVRDRIRELRRVPARELRDHPRNWRSHPSRQRRALAAMLAEVGFADALIAFERDGELCLIDGHLRKGLDPDRVVPVLVLDVSEAEADKLLVTLDPLAGLAGADPEPLRALLARVSSSSEAVRALLGELAASAPPLRPRGDPEAIPQVPSSPRTGPGDLWTLGDHRLVCGDATSGTDVARLMGGERARLLWTDPPYGVSYVGKTARALRVPNDERAGLGKLLARALAAIDPALLPGAAIYLASPAGPAQAVFLQAFGARWERRQSLAWVKDTFVLGHADYQWAHEMLHFGYKAGRGRRGRGAGGWYGGNACSSVLAVPRPKASPEHPTAKPVELIRRCLANSSVPGDAVADPFLGSGSTLIAAEQLGLRGRFLELDPAYVDVAVRRWEAFTGRVARRTGGRDGRGR